MHNLLSGLLQTSAPLYHLKKEKSAFKTKELYSISKFITDENKRIQDQDILYNRLVFFFLGYY